MRISKTALRILFLFGILVSTFLVPLASQAHNSDMGNRNEGVVYDGDNPWDAEHVGWFTHDKERTSAITWGTYGYWITTYTLSNYAIPADAMQVTVNGNTGLPSASCASGYVDTKHLFDRKEVIRWVAASGATPNENGVYTVYAQPEIVVHKNGTITTHKSLDGWRNAAPWADSSTFESHYNKPLHITYSTLNDVKVEYKTLTDGKDYDANTELTSDEIKKYPKNYTWNWGSKHKYSEAGAVDVLKKAKAGNSGEKIWVLTGVRITNTTGTGTTGSITVGVDDNNHPTCRKTPLL